MLPHRALATLPAICLLATACSDEALAPTGSEGAILSRRWLHANQVSRERSDVLLVVDHALVTENVAALEGQLARIGTFYDDDRYDLHLAIVDAQSTTGLFVAPATQDGRRFLTDSCIDGVNFQGKLTDAIAGAVRQSSVDGPNRALQAAMRALGADAAGAPVNPGFRRDGAGLTLVFLSAGDDDSRRDDGLPLDVTELEAFLAGQQSDWGVRVAVRAVLDAPRLAAVAGGYCSAPLNSAEMPLECFAAHYFWDDFCEADGAMLDRDPTVEGTQLECRVNLHVLNGDGTATVSSLPRCQGDELTPCWLVSEACQTADHDLGIAMRPTPSIWSCPWTYLEIECACGPAGC